MLVFIMIAFWTVHVVLSGASAMLFMPVSMQRVLSNDTAADAERAQHGDGECLSRAAVSVKKQVQRDETDSRTAEDQMEHRVIEKRQPALSTRKNTESEREKKEKEQGTVDKADHRDHTTESAHPRVSDFAGRTSHLENLP